MRKMLAVSFGIVAIVQIIGFDLLSPIHAKIEI